MEMLGPNLASWTKNCIKLELTVSNQMEKSTKQKRSGNGVGVEIKMI